MGHIDALTEALQKADAERTAHLRGLDELTAALQQAGDERAAQLGHIDALTRVLDSRPVRVAMKLFGIAFPRFLQRYAAPAQKQSRIEI